MKTKSLKFGLLLMLAAVLLSSCAPAATPTPVTVEVTRVVASTPVVEQVVATAAPTAAVVEKPFRIAVILPSSKDDAEWSQSLVEGLNKVQKEMGADKLEVAVSENVWQVPNAAEAVRDYATQGYNLIIAHGAQYGTSLAQIAPDFPETSFAWGTTTNTFQADGINNIFAYQPEAGQSGYVNGVIAAMISKSGILGVTGPVEAGDAKLYNDGFKKGAEATKPGIKVNISYTGSFSDVSLMSAAAETQIANGADVLTGTSQSVVGAIGVAKTKKVTWLAGAWFQDNLAPEVIATDIVYRWEVILRDMIASNKAGVPGGKVYYMTFKNGGLEMNYNSAYTLPADVKAAADAAIQGIKDGTIKP